ncbi:MAG: membrane protein insertion efficiency factor YidD [Cytophagales bacterium]
MAKQSLSTYSTSYQNLKTKKGFFLFKFYKTIFSSQDIPNVCQFHPSCSEYGLLQIQENGYFVGTMATFDRLSRCNGSQSRKQYQYDKIKKKFEDFP